MATNLITPPFRGAFVQVFRPTAMKGQPDAPKKYSVRAVFPADADLTELRAEAREAANEKWGNNLPKVLRSPFRTNGELDSPVVGMPDDAVVMTFSASEDRKPGVVGPDLQDIIDDSECYSGAWYRAQVRAFAYETSGNKGVSFGLQNLQKLKDDSPLGGKMPASKAFTQVEGAGEKKSANELFD